MDDMLENVVSFLFNGRLFEFRSFLSEIHIQDWSEKQKAFQSSLFCKLNTKQ